MKITLYSLNKQIGNYSSYARSTVLVTSGVYRESFLSELCERSTVLVTSGVYRESFLSELYERSTVLVTSGVYRESF